jgi:endonuclease/exonuclease/phosphatase (EEP) superfamily protein YafD
LFKKATLAIFALGLVILGALLCVSLFNRWSALADSLSHFRVHFIVGLVALCAIFTTCKKWRLAICAAMMSIIGAYSIYPNLPLLSPHENSTKPLKLIQFNTLFNNPTPERSLAWIKDEAPDFVMLQEVSQKNALAIYEGLAVTLPYGVLCKFATVGGVAVRSKYPMIDQGCSEGQGMTWLRTDINGKQVSFASVHLHWPYPFRQWRQLDRLDVDLKAIPRPVILTGDFNAAAWSEAAQRVATATETHVVPGLRFTLRMGPRPIGPIPFLPIDQVLMPDDVKVGDISLGPPIGSDHLAVVTTFEFK